MRHFWQGFDKKNSGPLQFKKHAIIVFWDPDSGEKAHDAVARVSSKFPTVKMRIINVKKDKESPIKHRVENVPSVLLLKDGREVERIEGRQLSPFLIENLFRKAHV
jgi:thioredoxin-like negative regulator of GroEL